MIPIQLKVSLLAALAVFFIIVLTLLKKRRLSLKYTLLWLLTGVVLLILVIFPELLLRFAAIIGTQSTMNTLYLFLIGFIMMLLLMLTSIVSKQTDRIAHLAQSNALLEERVRELEKKLAEADMERSAEGTREADLSRESADGSSTNDCLSGRSSAPYNIAYQKTEEAGCSWASPDSDK